MKINGGGHREMGSDAQDGVGKKSLEARSGDAYFNDSKKIRNTRR